MLSPYNRYIERYLTMNQYSSIPQTTLGNESEANGMPFMRSEVPPGPQSLDKYSNPAFSNQPIINNTLSQQNKEANITTGAKQANANGRAMEQLNSVEKSNAQALLQRRISEAIYSNIDSLREEESTMTKLGKMPESQLAKISNLISTRKA